MAFEPRLPGTAPWPCSGGGGGGSCVDELLHQVKKIPVVVLSGGRRVDELSHSAQPGPAPRAFRGVGLYHHCCGLLSTRELGTPTHPVPSL